MLSERMPVEIVHALGYVKQAAARVNARIGGLDANLAEVRQLEQKMGKEDKGRMEQYLTSVREAEIRTRRADAWLDGLEDGQAYRIQRVGDFD